MSSKGKTRVLIIEDNTPLVLFIVHALTRAGCDVETARTGKRAMELVSESRFDLIALDIKLPDANGFEICNEIKQRHISRKTPIVFVSASSSEEDRRRSFTLGAVDYITKPFEVTDFIFRIVLHAKVKSVKSNISDKGADTNTQSFCDTPQCNQ